MGFLPLARRGTFGTGARRRRVGAARSGADQAAMGTQANAETIMRLNDRAQLAGKAVHDVLDVAGALSRQAESLNHAFDDLVRQQRAV